MKKIISKFGIVLLLLFVVSSFALATNEMKIIDVYEAKGNPNAKVIFYDNSLKHQNGNNIKGGFGLLTNSGEVYTHSYYVYYSKTKTQSDCGPLEDVEHLISVAKGCVENLTSSVMVSGTVTYEQSVSAGIKDVVNASLTSTVSGTVSVTYGTQTTYVGPPENSPYNSRNYYSGVNYDKYNVVLKRYDVYAVYDVDGNIVENIIYESYEYVNGVKKPKIVSWSEDSLY